MGIIEPGAEATRQNPQGPYVFATADERAALGVSETPVVLYVTARDGVSADNLLDSVTRAADGAQVYEGLKINTPASASLEDKLAWVSRVRETMLSA